MKRFLSYTLSFFILLLLTSCTDDWMPYENTEYCINYEVEGDIFLISEIESELLELVAEYDDDVKLTFVQYQFESETSGTVEFQFFRDYETNGKYYSVLITLFANIDDNIIYKVNYEEGTSKRVTGYRNAIIRNNENAYNIKTILKAFSETYDLLDDEQKRSLISFLIKDIQIYPKDENESILKSIEFKFPVFYDGEYVRQILWDKDKHVETVVLLSKL